MKTLKRLIRGHGLTAIAAKMGCSYQAVRKWEIVGVPAERVIGFCRALEWEVTPHELRPDIYPHETDGMPKD